MAVVGAMSKRGVQHYFGWKIATLMCILAKVGAQLVPQHTHHSPLTQPQLSPAQQGAILSDIQQHQHRFGQQFQPQQTPGAFQPPHHFPQPTATPPQQVQQQQTFSHQQLQDPRLFQQQQQQLQLQQQRQQLNPLSQESFAQNEFLNTLPLVNSLPQNAVLPTQQSQVFPNAVLPTVQPSQPTNRIVQHHTQTSFTPNYQQDIFNQQQHFIKPRPTQDPLALIEQQIKSLDPEKHKQKIKELREKQSIIEKHNQFVEKQYEKALKKAQQDHQEFLEQQKEQKKKLYQRLYKVTSSEHVPYSPAPAPRVIYPEEIPLFEQAVKQYYIEHPTTTTTTTTTTTEKSTTERERSESRSSKVSSVFLPTAVPKLKTIQSLEDLDQLQKQYKSQKIRKDDLLEQLRLAIAGDPKNLSSREVSLANGKKIQLVAATDSKNIPKGKEEEITLPDGKKVTVIRADNPDNKQDEEVVLPSGHQVKIIRTTDPKSALEEITLPNGQKAKLLNAASDSKSSASTAQAPVYKTEEITLPNGEKIEVIKTTDPNLVTGGVKIEPGSDLEKLVLSRTTTTTTVKPPAAILEELTKSVVPPSNYEILKTGASGGLESISGTKLPQQKKVTFVLLEEQSDGTLKVQGIKGNGKDKPDVDVDSILKKIKQGDLKLPTSSSAASSSTTSTTTQRPQTSTVTTYRPVFATVTPNSFATGHEGEDKDKSPSETDADDVPILKTNIGTHLVSSSTATTLLNKEFDASDLGTTVSTSKRTRTPHIIYQQQHQSTDLSKQASSSQNSLLEPNTVKTTLPSSSTINAETFTINRSNSSASSSATNYDLPTMLKKSELFAMAKFLRQSGLDTILNETGPYTVFVPSDKAFRTLLVQLGGPERAEEKFRENPRLLSGLLLHHVIPGAFKIESLQDEMTGVSLAGTQLRVNQYNMHDAEWNDIKVTTINGARILDEKKDIWIPQGVAHAIDRVMFPLPVGDIVQTLQSDRERRFTTFLRAIFGAQLADTLQGSKTYTLFVPTDRAFSSMTATEVTKLVTDKQAAKELILRHMLPGTLYTAGMRYYQIRNSLLDDKILTFSKQGGKVKVNNVLISTQNIPATNGVIHSIDSLL